MQHKIVALLLIVGLLAGSGNAHSVSQNRAKRDLTDAQRDRLSHLYNAFNTVFQERYRRTENSVQFAALVINQPTNLQPCPFQMNDDQGVLSSSHNYLAYTPRPSPTRPPPAQQHAEVRIVTNFSSVTQGVDVVDVYLVTHFSPCRFCSDILRTFVRNNRNIIFHIGYVERYQNEENLNYFIQQVGNEPNVMFGQIASRQNRVCHDELRRRSSTCSLSHQCGDEGGGGCFPANALVNINDLVSSTKAMADIKIGDEVLAMTTEGELLYSPVIAFLDRAPIARQIFIEITTEDQHKLQLTHDHLIFTDNSSKPVYASDVEVGNYVYTVDFSSHSAQSSVVTSIKGASSVGLYAPLTQEGTIIVDGVLASCYAELSASQHDIHSVFSPLRFLYSIIPQIIRKDQVEEGVHWYAQALIHVNHYMKMYLPRSLLPSMIAN